MWGTAECACNSCNSHSSSLSPAISARSSFAPQLRHDQQSILYASTMYFLPLYLMLGPPALTSFTPEHLQDAQLEFYRLSVSFLSSHSCTSWLPIRTSYQDVCLSVSTPLCQLSRCQSINSFTKRRTGSEMLPTFSPRPVMVVFSGDFPPFHLNSIHFTTDSFYDLNHPEF